MGPMLSTTDLWNSNHIQTICLSTEKVSCYYLYIQKDILKHKTPSLSLPQSEGQR